MPNIKSAKKRVKVIATKTLRNARIKSQVKTAIKKLEASVTVGNKAEATTLLSKTVSTIDKATSKGIFHKKTASRKKARLSKLVNALAE